MKWVLVFLSGIMVGLGGALAVVVNLPELPVYIRYLV